MIHVEPAGNKHETEGYGLTEAYFTGGLDAGKAKTAATGVKDAGAEA
jgi:hypothetical protein